MLALLVKPLLLRFMAHYRVRDFVRMFVPAFVSLALCGSLSAMIYAVLPRNLWALLPNCALMAIVNAVMLLTFVATPRVQAQFPRALRKFGGVGDRLASAMGSYFSMVQKLRRTSGLERVIG